VKFFFFEILLGWGVGARKPALIQSVVEICCPKQGRNKILDFDREDSLVFYVIPFIPKYLMV
jgi:hypothetical protein